VQMLCPRGVGEGILVGLRVGLRQGREAGINENRAGVPNSVYWMRPIELFNFVPTKLFYFTEENRV
jgi:hypothetical protein